MGENKKTVWFPAQKYGFGWGLPVTWQGWIVILSYTLLVIVGIVLKDKITYLPVYFIFLTALLILICWEKGEKPRWRWGNENT